MKSPGDPEIISVDRVDNAIAVTFDDNSSAIYPAILLHAARGVADALIAKELEEAHHLPL